MNLQLDIADTRNSDLEARVLRRWDSLTKPPGSLGRLESLVLELALMQGTDSPKLKRKALALFCADHGVTAEGVSAFPREVTAQMVQNFLSGGAAISVLCRKHGIEPVVVDAGVDGPVAEGALDYKIAQGTANFVEGPAMTAEQAEKAVRNGMGLAREIGQRADIAVVGEMGIGNTTAASALLCAFSGCAAADAAGAGTGLDASRIAHKGQVIARALALHSAAVEQKNPMAILAAVGGFEIAMMAGFLLGAAAARMPVVVDGFICCASVLVARAINPRVMHYLIFSHKSAESGHRRMLAELNAKPVLDLDMRLGEASGGVLALSILESALALYDEMATFEQVGVSKA